MSEMEQEIVYLMNLARLNGSKFWNTYLKDELAGKSGSYVSSLQSDLASVRNLPMLYPDAGLVKAAKYHVNDMSKNNFFDHSSSDGTRFYDRVQSFYNSSYCTENISAGMGTAIGVVAQLLLDEGIPSLGHRKNILDSRCNAVGVACGPLNYYRYCCCQDFGESLLTPLRGNGGGNNGGYDGGDNGYDDGNDDNDGNDGGYHSIYDDSRWSINDRIKQKNWRKKPFVPNIEMDASWDGDEESMSWYQKDGDYYNICYVPTQSFLYYDIRQDKFYLWDRDSETWNEVKGVR